MPTLHFVCGPIGAGKTTYAIALANRVKAVRLSADEWMGNLFAADRPVTEAPAWVIERALRCEGQMWALAEQLVLRGIHVVFDINPSRQEDRDRFRARASETPAEIKLHYLDVDRDIRRARVRRRNAQHTSAVVFQVSEPMFDASEASFEPPTDDELYGAMIVCCDGLPGDPAVVS
ncbi:MAG: AAA family ATPase [Polyangiaceae bacterium]